MTGLELTASDWISLITHVKKWLSNLRRAHARRREESKEALRSVILAVRETEAYVRRINQGGNPSPKKEEKLSLLWTELSFKLEDIDLHKLARRCALKGMYWADPARLDEAFLEKAGTSLAEVEKLARMSLAEISRP